MRTALFRTFCASAVVVALGGCPKQEEADEGEDVEDLTIVVEADRSRIAEEEQALIEKKESVEQERVRIQREKSQIAERLASLSKKDRKQREKLEAEQKRLRDQEDKIRKQQSSFDEEREKLAKAKNQLLDKITALTATGKGGMTIQQREEAIARREKRVAEREREVAEREKALADRETQVTQNLQQIAGMMGGIKAGRAVAIPAPSSNANASRGDAVKAQKQFRSKMDGKGILMGDLPSSAQDLESQAKSAMSSKDFGTAEGAYGQLISMVDAIRVDQPFVQGKFNRISREYETKKGRLGDGQVKRARALLDEVSDSFSDGRYDRANRKINQIYSVIGGDK